MKTIRSVLDSFRLGPSRRENRATGRSTGNSRADTHLEHGIDDAGNKFAKLNLSEDCQLKFAYIPAGPFRMGADQAIDSDADETDMPQHEVPLGGYWMGKWLVTVGQYCSFQNATGYKRDAVAIGTTWPVISGSGLEMTIKRIPEIDQWRNWRGQPQWDYPAAGLSLRDGLSLCEWATKVSGLVIDVPTEAEWEKAARGTDARLFPWGNSRDGEDRYARAPDGSYYRWGDHFSRLGIEVGAPLLRSVSPYGCEDMSGALWQWTRSLAELTPNGPALGYPYTRHQVEREEISAPPGCKRVLRGASYKSSDARRRCAYRYFSGSDYLLEDFGLRVVLRQHDP